MIAMWMAYTLVTGILIAAMCWLLERIGRAARQQTRAVWAIGMMAMLLISAAAMVRGAPLTAAGSQATASALVQPTVPVGAEPSTQIIEPARRSDLTRSMAALEARVAVAAARLAAWDRTLLVLWALFAAFLGGIVSHAALEGLRLRHGLRRHEIDGTAVLVTDGLGPSAIGVGEPAILMPRWALELEDELMRLVLRHEREHLTARDPFLLLVTLFAVVLVPWHLPLWWSRNRLRLAIEVDCDSRVLRAHPDVRRYAQLLLLTAQRAAHPSWPNRAVASVVAPLGPRPSHLARRIATMTQPRTTRTLFRTAPLALGAVAIAGLLVSLPAPPGALAQVAAAESVITDNADRVIVRLTSVGSEGAYPISILVYTTGGARVGIGLDEPVARADTLRLTGVPAITADVTEGEVHIEVHGPGRVSVAGDVTGGPAQRVSATGRHIVLLEGGVGIMGGDRIAR